MIKRAGQIIPKYLVKSKNRFSHAIRFGCDVEINGREIKALTNGNIICITKGFIGGKNGRPKRYIKDVAIRDSTTVIGFTANCGSSFKVNNDFDVRLD